MTACAAEGCELPAIRVGFCGTHYARQRADGTTCWRKHRKHTPESFWLLVDQSAGPDGCWPFMREAGSVRGYGRLSFEGRLWLAHRLAYRLANGEIPEGALVRHRCDNPPCCNPRHLEPGDGQANARDREGRGRGGGAKLRGCNHPRAKLTEEIVRQIRALHGNGVSYREIALTVGTSKSQVYSVVKRKTWGSVH